MYHSVYDTAARAGYNYTEGSENSGAVRHLASVADMVAAAVLDLVTDERVAAADSGDTRRLVNELLRCQHPHLRLRPVLPGEQSRQLPLDLQPRGARRLALPAVRGRAELLPHADDAAGAAAAHRGHRDRGQQRGGPFFDAFFDVFFDDFCYFCKHKSRSRPLKTCSNQKSY